MTTLQVTLVEVGGKPVPPLVITVVIRDDLATRLDIDPDLCYTGITS